MSLSKDFCMFGGTVAHIYERQSAGDSEWWKTRLLSSPPFTRFFKIGAITKKVLEISYESYGSEFPNSFYKKSRCDPRPRFFEWEPNQTETWVVKKQKKGKIFPQISVSPPPALAAPTAPPSQIPVKSPPTAIWAEMRLLSVKGVAHRNVKIASKGIGWRDLVD